MKWLGIPRFNYRVILLVLLLHPFYLLAHIGSPGIIMQTQAGPYQLMVTIEPPDVIPGVAKIMVLAQSEGLQQVSARAVYYRTGGKGAPEPDKLVAVANAPGQFSGEVWMMATGSGSVQLQLNGTQGNAEIVVPVVAVSTATRVMPAQTTFLLLALGAFLVVLFITIFGKAMADALIPSGNPISSVNKRKLGYAVGTLLMVSILWGGKTWWNSWANDYKRHMYKPMQATSQIVHTDSGALLLFTIDTTHAQRASMLSYLVPDHGKWMHLFLVRMPGMDVFAHIHPQRIDTATYQALLPPLPPGKYQIFADIVYLTSFTETISDTLVIPHAISTPVNGLPYDDGMAKTLPVTVVDAPAIGEEQTDLLVCGKPGQGIKLPGGRTMVWQQPEQEGYLAGRLYTLHFNLLDAAGKPAVIQSYMGMTGHAVVMRHDAQVYTHLHPVGTFSQAAIHRFTERIADTAAIFQLPDRTQFRDSMTAYLQWLNELPHAGREALLMQGMDHTNMQMDANGNMEHESMVSFPYMFPATGRYRIWVQVRHQGTLVTGSFDCLVR